ncbi:MAG: Hint domain-containing protein [bacterium]|nr:Hint domain-containing protein [bacterium]
MIETQLKKYTPIKNQKDKKYRVCFYSNSPQLSTGYAKVLREVCSRLVKDPSFDVHVIAENYKGPPTPYQGYTIWGMSPDIVEHRIQATFFPAFMKTLEQVNPDVVIALEDTFTLANQGFYDWSLKYGRPKPFIMYLPLDGRWTPNTGLPILRMVDKIVSMAKFTQAAAKEDGFDSDVIYHGVDLFTFKPVSPEQKKEIRKRYGIPEDCFLIFNYGRNNLRKNNPQLCYALAEYMKDKDPTKYKALLHIMDYNSSECNLIDTFKRLIKKDYGIDFIDTGHVMFNPRAQGFDKGVSDHEVADYIKMSDVVVSASSGEGYGLIMAEGMACFPKGTKIWTGEKNISIEDIRVGDYVLTHKNRLREVTQIMQKKYTGKMYNILFSGNNEPIICTEEHPILTENGWKPAKNLKTNEKILYKQENHHIRKRTIFGKELTAELGEIFGWYLAEGSLKSNTQTLFTLGPHEVKHAKRLKTIIENNYTNNVKIQEKPGKRIDVIVNDELLTRTLHTLFDRGSYYKKIPFWFREQSSEIITSLLKAYYQGDGFLREGRPEATTISRDLAYGIRDLLLTISLPCYIRKSKGFQNKKDTYIVAVSEKDGRKFFRNEEYSRRGGKVLIKYDNGCLYQTIKKIETKNVKNINVFNFSVFEDESYVVNQVSVHNCGIPIIQTLYTTPQELLLDSAEGIGPRGIGVDYDTTIVSSFNTEHAFVSVKKLAQAIDYLEKHPDVRKEIGVNGRKFAELFCNWDYIVEQWKNVIRETVD